MKKMLASTTAALTLLATSLVAQAADLPMQAYKSAPVCALTTQGEPS